MEEDGTHGLPCRRRSSFCFGKEKVRSSQRNLTGVREMKSLARSGVRHRHQA
jgi:hypothetical protein